MSNENNVESKNQGERHYNQTAPSSFVNQPMNAVGPNFSISNQQGGGKNMKNHQGPSLFGQNQLKNGFGPVYAVPPVPWEGPPPVVTAATLKKELAQSQSNSKPPTSSGQKQAKCSPNPGHGNTTGPWQHGDYQYMWHNQQQPCYGYPQAVMPYYVYPTNGYQ